MKGVHLCLRGDLWKQLQKELFLRLHLLQSSHQRRTHLLREGCPTQRNLGRRREIGSQDYPQPLLS